MSQQSERTRIRNHPERAVPDESAEILARDRLPTWDSSPRAKLSWCP